MKRGINLSIFAIYKIGHRPVQILVLAMGNKIESPKPIWELKTVNKMGGYTNYEVVFDDFIDWDDNNVKLFLKPFNVEYIYLRDMDKPRVILSVYSHNPVKNILMALKSVYPVGICYRIYNSDEAWIAFI